MRWWLISVRGFALPCGLAVGGVVLANAIAKFAAALPGGPLGSLAQWLPHAGFLAALFLSITFVIRLRRWEKGDGRDCRYCCGPLGRLRIGRVMYGKQLPDFRRCYNCGNATPEPDAYESDAHP